MSAEAIDPFVLLEKQERAEGFEWQCVAMGRKSYQTGANRGFCGGARGLKGAFPIPFAVSDMSQIT